MQKVSRWIYFYTFFGQQMLILNTLPDIPLFYVCITFYVIFLFSCKIWSNVQEATREGWRGGELPPKSEPTPWQHRQRDQSRPLELDRTPRHDLAGGDLRVPALQLASLPGPGPAQPLHRPQPKPLHRLRSRSAAAAAPASGGGRDGLRGHGGVCGQHHPQPNTFRYQKWWKLAGYW